MASPKHRFWRIAARSALTGLELILAGAFLASLVYAALGHFQWYQTRRELTARQEKLSLAELAPPPISEEQNFFGDPFWRDSGSGKASPWGGLDAPLNAAEMDSLHQAYPSLRWNTYHQISLLSVLSSVWSFRAPGYTLDQKAAAQFTVAQLAPAQPLLKKVEQWLDRPASRLLPGYADFSYDSELPQMTHLLKIAQILNLESRSHLTLGDSAVAFSELQVLGKLTHVVEQEPLSFALTVRTSLAGMYAEGIKRGLDHHAWSEEQLAAFGDTLAGVNLLPQLPLVLRGERAQFNGFVAHFRPFPGDDGDGAWPKFSRSTARRAWDFVMRPADQAYFNRRVQKEIDEAASIPQTGTGATNVADSAAALSSQRWASYRFALSSALLPSVVDQTCVIVQTQDRLIQARLACALERYRLKAGAYPASLAALVPAFLPDLPLDVVSRKPMNYRLKNPAEFRLWSVGWNESDDGGLADSFHRKLGDWPWERSAG